MEILGVAAGAGYGAILIDSLSHYWMGTDGLLEQADRRKHGTNSFSGWKEVGPEERRMIDALIAYPGHVVVTMRSKTEYVIEEDSRGRKVPRKVGMKPVQHDGIEYEFDIVGDLDHQNTLTVVKTRIHTLNKAVIPLPGPELADQIRDWLSDGDQVPSIAEYRSRALAAGTGDDLRALYREVEQNRLLAGPTIDLSGEPTVLGDLINQLAQDIPHRPLTDDEVDAVLAELNTADTLDSVSTIGRRLGKRVEMSPRGGEIIAAATARKTALSSPSQEAIHA